jgi:serine/threonine-protein kinase
MSEVYRARDELLGRDVAVKVLSARLSTDSAFVERFRREAQAAANLSHPNIVSLYDYGSDNGDYYIVMEFIDGRGLDEIVKQEGPLLPERAAEIAADVARALERAHSQGLVHRDVKPSNVMVTSYGQTKVTDFGIVRALGGDGEATMTQTGMVIGTAAYLSPEQAQGAPIDARSDVYSLGCVLYELLTGRPPFTGDTPLSIAYKHVREHPEPPSSANADVPTALDSITMKALAKNPANRYSSAREMREDLERFAAGEKVSATPLLAGTTAVAPAAGGTQVMTSTGLPYEDEEEDEGRSRAAVYVIAALVILGLFALLAWLFANNIFGKQVVVPDVVGLRQAEAEEQLGEAGFEVEAERRPSKRDEGIVVEQDPPGEEEADEGSTVTIFVSSGPRQVDVPDLTGMTRGEAEEELEGEGLELGEVFREANADVEEGQVFDQDPGPGEQAETGSPVDITVSAGPEPTLVPTVIGQTQQSAEAEIAAAGLGVDVTTAPSDQAAGIVIAQDPEGGAELAPGDVVTITVSEGPEEQEMPDVRGENADDAEAFLESDYGLNVDQVEQACADAVPPGTVCEQDPAPGTAVSEGDSATLFVQPGDSALPVDAFVAALFVALRSWF